MGINNYASIILRRRRWIVALLQSALIWVALTGAWLLRFEFDLPNKRALLLAMPILIVVRLLLMPLFNLTHGWWRYTGVSDATDVMKAVGAGSVVFLLVYRYVLGMKSIPLSIYPLEGLLTLLLLVGVRLLSRIIAERLLKNGSYKRLLLIGAGHAAQMVVRQTQQVATGFHVIGCLDDDPYKARMKVLGIPVLGNVDQLAQALLSKYDVDEVLIAIPSATSTQMRRFVELCKGADIPFRTIPGLAELINPEVMMQQVREVSLEDLLGRESVRLDLASVRSQIQGKVVMVTGAAGSIGSELCRQILRYAPARLICVDQNETGMFDLQRDLDRVKGPNAFCVADVKDGVRMQRLFSMYGVRTVFHAAAYKHVPMMEANVEEAVTNNIFGLMSLLEVAQTSTCETFIMISSDKAVNPSSVMGCTKRVGELILAAWPSPRLRCVSVRFGNVLGSNGSVVPVFQEQIRQNKPITITHPEINRFFMTIPEAVSLVLQACAVGKHGDILVLDMGRPIRIVDLAQDLIRLSGKSPSDVEIKFIGLRPGEKLYEDLFYADERILPTPCNKVKRTERAKSNWAQLNQALHKLNVAALSGDALSIRARLKEIVPEFSGEGALKHASEAPLENALVDVQVILPKLRAFGAVATGATRSPIANR